jgi:hypothetical protein
MFATFQAQDLQTGDEIRTATTPARLTGRRDW